MKRMHTDDATWGPPSDSHPFGVWLDDREPFFQPPASRVQEHREEAFTSTVDGVVQRVDAENLWLRASPAGDDAGVFDVCVAHELPPTIDLRPLVGRSVRATRVCEEGNAAHRARTLTINGHDGRVWLIARAGTVQGVTHALSARDDEPGIRAALSQRPLGPLVIGTSDLQRLVQVGASALLRLPSGYVFCALFVERRADGTASYVIADEALVVGQAS